MLILKVYRGAKKNPESMVWCGNRCGISWCLQSEFVSYNPNIFVTEMTQLGICHSCCCYIANPTWHIVVTCWYYNYMYTLQSVVIILMLLHAYSCSHARIFSLLGCELFLFHHYISEINCLIPVIHEAAESQNTCTCLSTYGQKVNNQWN